MSEQQAVVYREAAGQLEHAMSVENVMAQVRAIQDLMKKAMKPGEHYGIIPGTSRKDKDGNELAKPSLLKPGAEKIGLMFRLAPSYTGQDCPVEHPGGHLEYRLTCTLTHIRTGEVWGQGVGSCSTMETKYRFRNQKTDTGLPIPADAKENKGHYRAQGFVMAKDEAGGWYWAKLERVEHDNPADYYNTVLKIAKKRAQVDATLTATAASDFFTQDLEDMAENGLINAEEKSAQPKREQPKADPPATPTTDQAQAPKNDVPKSAPKQDDGGDVFDTLENELYDFCRGDAAAMQEKLQELTEFPGKDKETGKPTGEMVPGKRFVSDLREKGKTAWAGSALKKLRAEVGR